MPKRGEVSSRNSSQLTHINSNERISIWNSHNQGTYDPRRRRIFADDSVFALTSSTNPILRTQWVEICDNDQDEEDFSASNSKNVYANV